MITSLQDTVTLHNGINMPRFGLGVYKAENGSEVIHAVKDSIKAGYRLIDTASFYDNEEGVGEGIKQSQIAREEIFVTTKVWNTDQGYESTLAAFDKSLKKMDLEYIDLYLVHWPVPGKYKETWKALEKLYKDGKVKAIGVSNFHIHHLEDLLKDAEIVPMVNQIELHPLLSQVEIREYCQSKGIRVEAWSPLARGRLLEHPVLKNLAEKYHKTVAQVILRWDLQSNIITIPKSTKEHRIIENANIFDFELSIHDMQVIDAINQNERTGPNPDQFDF